MRAPQANSVAVVGWKVKVHKTPPEKHAHQETFTQRTTSFSSTETLRRGWIKQVNFWKRTNSHLHRRTQTSLWICVPGGGSVAALWFRWETYARCIATAGMLFHWKMSHVRRRILDKWQRHDVWEEQTLCRVINLKHPETNFGNGSRSLTFLFFLCQESFCLPVPLMRGTQWGGDCWSKIGRVTCQFGKGLLYAVYSSFGRIHVRQNVFANQRFACWHCGLHKTYSGFLQVDHDACDPVARENRSVLLFAAVFLATFATARWSDMVIPFLSHDHFNVIHHQRGGRVQCTFSANIRDKELNAALLDSAKPRNSAI